MRKAASVFMFILLLVFVLTFVFNIPIAILQVETTLYVDPSAIHVQVQNDFTVNVNVSDVVNLYGFGCHLGYNTSILDAQTVTIHPPFESPIIVKNETDGYVSVIATLPPSFPKITGSFALFTVTFKATSPGNSVLNLYDTLLIGEEILPMPHSTTDGSVAVYSSNLLLETDKPVYKLGENITTTITNIGNETVLWVGRCPVPWDIFTYPENRCVFAAFPCYCVFELAPGGTVTYTWNQSDWYTIGPVEPGMYEVRDNQAWGLSMYFKIVGGEIIVPDDYSTIQEAISNATLGETIFVRNGTYNEHLNVTKSLTILAENVEATVVIGFEIHADNVKVSGFTMIGGGYEGVSLFSSSQCNISNNVIHSPLFPIDLRHSSNNYIANNRIPYSSGSGAGITLFCSNSNIVRRNIISLQEVGIHALGSYNNTLDCNELSNNYCAIYINEGSFNHIYHNNFVNNQVGAADWGVNVWDDGCEGNYWSNYNGTDLDGDGVGDTDLPWEGVDNYPLMNPYWKPGDVNHDLKIDIYDVVRITAVYSSQEGDLNWNPHADLAEPYGIIDIYDVVTCTKDYGIECGNP